MSTLKIVSGMAALLCIRSQCANGVALERTACTQVCSRNNSIISDESETPHRVNLECEAGVHSTDASAGMMVEDDS